MAVGRWQGGGQVTGVRWQVAGLEEVAVYRWQVAGLREVPGLWEGGRWQMVGCRWQVVGGRW